jgi:hypothetical protein
MKNQRYLLTTTFVLAFGGLVAALNAPAIVLAGRHSKPPVERDFQDCVLKTCAPLYDAQDEQPWCLCQRSCYEKYGITAPPKCAPPPTR